MDKYSQFFGIFVPNYNVCIYLLVIIGESELLTGVIHLSIIGVDTVLVTHLINQLVKPSGKLCVVCPMVAHSWTQMTSSSTKSGLSQRMETISPQ